MKLDIGANAVVVAVFVNGTGYEIYYGFFGEADNRQVRGRYLSRYINSNPRSLSKMIPILAEVLFSMRFKGYIINEFVGI